ncbi:MULTISPECIES: hypothetical protein [Paenibacillus]|nr:MULTISPECIES: hypothetical protein [Paenibacillus]
MGQEMMGEEMKDGEMGQDMMGNEMKDNEMMVIPIYWCSIFRRC